MVDVLSNVQLSKSLPMFEISSFLLSLEMWNEDYLPSPHSSLCSLSYRNEDMYMRAGYSRPVLVLSTLFSEEESIFRNMDKFSFFLLLMVLEYKDFKISQWHVIYALFAEAVTRCFSLPHYQNT